MSFLSCIFKPLAYLSPIICAAWLTPLGRYYLRIGTFIFFLSTVGSTGIIAAAVLFIVGRKYDVNYVIGHCFYWVASRALNLKVEVEGEENLETRPAVIVGNHQSMVDILWLGRCVP
jgi:lysophosphatidate acyltransferase